MHRLPKIFSHSSERRKSRIKSSSDSVSGSNTSSSRQDAKPKKLDRRNAVKDVNYEFSPSTSASSSLHSSEEYLRTRSLDLYGGITSFRVDGTDGEFEIICQAFGFSGIDDFAISPEDYESMKVRSSSAPVLFGQKFNPISYQENEVDCDDAVECSRDVINHPIQGNDVYIESLHVSSGGVSELSERLGGGVKISNVVYSDNTSVRSIGNGIKGMRPPFLEGPNCVSGFERESCSNENDEDMRRNVVMREKNSVMSECCSFTTSSNDSSSTTTPMSSISPNWKFRRVIEGWQKGELLGRGSFGSVYEGIADDGFFFAVKEVSLLDKGDDGKQRIIQLEQEIALLSQFEHENIVQYYGTKKDESHLYIFLELVTKGSLLSLYQKYELRAPQVSAYTRQILNGLKYLHDRNVVHRDIKCANILVHTNALVKLADFGLAKATKLNDVKSCKGTAFWMAPEVVRSRGYGLAADIWSLGCTVLEMLTRRFPYSNLENQMAALYRIGRGERPPIPDSLPIDAKDFILECLQVDPSLRPTANQLLEHPFVKRPLPSSSSNVS